MDLGNTFTAPRVLAGAILLLLLTLLPVSAAHADGPPGGTLYPVQSGSPFYGPAYAPPAAGFARPRSLILYQVEPGDTLFGIARRFGVNLFTLVRINHIFNPNIIFAGMRLAIPRVASIPPTQTFIVRPGDTLLRIAIRFHTSVIALSLANNIPNPNLIFVGMRLIIPNVHPSASGSQAPAPAPYGSQVPSYAPPPAATTMPGGAMMATVSMKNIAFDPKTLTVHAGTTVVWTNEESGAVPHTVTSGTPGAPSGMFDSGTLNPGQSFQFTFMTPGTVAYFCRIHGAMMTGVVNVVP